MQCRPRGLWPGPVAKRGAILARQNVFVEACMHEPESLRWKVFRVLGWVMVGAIVLLMAAVLLRGN